MIKAQDGNIKTGIWFSGNSPSDQGVGVSQILDTKDFDSLNFFAVGELNHQADPGYTIIKINESDNSDMSNSNEVVANKIIGASLPYSFNTNLPPNVGFYPHWGIVNTKRYITAEFQYPGLKSGESYTSAYLMYFGTLKETVVTK